MAPPLLFALVGCNTGTLMFVVEFKNDDTENAHLHTNEQDSGPGNRVSPGDTQREVLGFEGPVTPFDPRFDLDLVATRGGVELARESLPFSTGRYADCLQGSFEYLAAYNPQNAPAFTVETIAESCEAFQVE